MSYKPESPRDRNIRNAFALQHQRYAPRASETGIHSCRGKSGGKTGRRTANTRIKDKGMSVKADANSMKQIYVWIMFSWMSSMIVHRFSANLDSRLFQLNHYPYIIIL